MLTNRMQIIKKNTGIRINHTCSNSECLIAIYNTRINEFARMRNVLD